jgi:hypothetical protein
VQQRTVGLTSNGKCSININMTVTREILRRVLQLAFLYQTTYVLLKTVTALANNDLCVVQRTIHDFRKSEKAAVTHEVLRQTLASP